MWAVELGTLIGYIFVYFLEIRPSQADIIIEVIDDILFLKQYGVWQPLVLAKHYVMGCVTSGGV